MRSVREGNLQLYLASFYRMLPWFFALDRYSYAHCATIYWFDMELLKRRCPNEYKGFSARNFQFLKTNKHFSRIALDQLHEQNNKYIESVSGATSLVNRHDSALVRWELCRPEIYQIIEESEEVESSTAREKKQKHHEESPIFTKNFIKDTTTLINKFPNNTLLLNGLTIINNTDMVFSPLSANPTKQPNTLKQFVGNLPKNCLSVFGHFVGLVLKGLKIKFHATWRNC